jgi:hypothetical protein
MSFEYSFTDDEILAEQWKTLLNLFNNNFIDFINKKISKSDVYYALFSKLSSSKSSKEVMNILHELCQGCKALILENKTENIDQQLRIVNELIELFGPEYVDTKPKLEDKDIETYYIRRNYLIINQWKSKIYDELDDQFGIGKYRDILPKEFRKFPLSN